VFEVVQDRRRKLVEIGPDGQFTVCTVERTRTPQVPEDMSRFTYVRVAMADPGSQSTDTLAQDLLDSAAHEDSPPLPRSAPASPMLHIPVPSSTLSPHGLPPSASSSAVFEIRVAEVGLLIDQKRERVCVCVCVCGVYVLREYVAVLPLYVSCETM
jgi:hypothetical protein